MALEKKPLSVPFAGGLDLKTDPLQVQLGRFLKLENATFTKLGSLTKRNGFGSLADLPDSTSSFITTFNGNLTATGDDLKVFSSGVDNWFSKGRIVPLQVSTIPLARSSTNQSQCDAAISESGLVCTVYTDNISSGTATRSVFKYTVADYETGETILAPATIFSSIGTVSFFPRVFSLDPHFILVFPIFNGTDFDLQYAAINSRAPATIASSSTLSTNFEYAFSNIGSATSFDGVVANNILYLSWNGASNSGTKSNYINHVLTKGTEVTIASSAATFYSVTADISGATPNIWTSGYLCGTSTGFAVATDSQLLNVFSAKPIITSGSCSNLASAAYKNINYVYSEIPAAFDFSAGLSPNPMVKRTDVFLTGSVAQTSIVKRGVGIGSKAFLIDSVSYFLSTFQTPTQPSYFLLNSSGYVAAKLSYGNGVGHVKTGPPLVTVIGSTANVPYLTKTQIIPVNKETTLDSVSQVAGVYSQSGTNLAKFVFGSKNNLSTEIGNNLHLNGGYLWMYDGTKPVEHNFHVYPEPIYNTVASGGAGLEAQTYFYVATYEWTDAQGNIHTSSPSVPIRWFIGSATTQGAIVNIPTLKLTAKTENPPKIVIYRWSERQPIYYQCTSVQTPILNDPNVETITFTDIQTDYAISGNSILYTNGGVLENIAAPACSAMATFDTRLWLINSENPDVLWYSKQVLETTPVETSDLLTIYVSPNDSAQGFTGPMKCIFPMDDKLIIFKKNALYYINGRGPDNTGANSQYSEPIFIAGTVGCERQKSIVLTPNGLMFQSDKGIWLLGRDLSTSYIGAPVEDYNDDEVLSALTIPGTNQVRFTLNNGVTLVYDYFFNQWSTYTGVPGISSTLYQNLHTYIKSNGQVAQETPGVYVDGSSPVLMSFQTGWVSLAGLQGYQRAYNTTFLATYKSPHTYSIGVAYDYDSSVTQLVNITPDNFSGAWGSGTSWGSVGKWGGQSAVEQWQVNFQRQQCQSFQLNFNEYFDPTKGTSPGAGLTLSGMDMVVGLKRGYPRNLAPTRRKS